MAGQKRKKKSPASPSGKGFGTKQNFDQEIKKAHKLIGQDQSQAALNYLHDLAQRYPHQPDLLELQMTVAFDLEEYADCGKAAAQLLELDPEHGNGLYLLASLSLKWLHPVLTRHLGQRALSVDAAHPMAEDIRRIVQKIEDEIDELVAELEGVPREEAIALLLNHEWGQLYLAWGEYEKSKAAELKVIAQKPDFMPAHNNLSLIALTAGELDVAIAQGEKVLSFEPENIHALANLVRYCFMQGDLTRAQEYGQRLKDSQATAWDPYTKKVEGLMFLRDHQGVLDIWQQAKAENIAQSNAEGGMVFHWVAVVQARMGNLAEAKQLWKEALKRSPELDIAQQNLNDLLLPVGERNSPWPFKGAEWMSPSLQRDFGATIESLSQSSNPERALSKAYFELSKAHPGFLLWLETMLMEGDDMGRRLAVEMASVVRSPELLEILKSFALSDNGPDSLRQRSAQILVEEEVISSEKRFMWLQGKWQELNLIGFQLTDEVKYSHSGRVGKKLSDAIELLREQDAESAAKAEALLKDALALEHTPDLLNNLAASYQLQGRMEEAIALCQQTVEAFPKYIPATAFLAQRHILDGELEEAEALLLPLLQCKTMHFQEFVQFSEVYLGLLYCKEDIKSLENWLVLWEELLPRHPRLKSWKKRLSSLSSLAKVKLAKEAPLKMRKSRSKGNKT